MKMLIKVLCNFLANTLSRECLWFPENVYFVWFVYKLSTTNKKKTLVKLYEFKKYFIFNDVKLYTSTFNCRKLENIYISNINISTTDYFESELFVYIAYVVFVLYNFRVKHSINILIINNVFNFRYIVG